MSLITPFLISQIQNFIKIIKKVLKTPKNAKKSETVVRQISLSFWLLEIDGKRQDVRNKIARFIGLHLRSSRKL